MPYYKWIGLTITGTKISGFSFARSEEQLEAFLLNNSIGLTSAYRVTKYDYSPTVEEKATVFSYLATLLSAKIPLPYALELIVIHCKDTYSKNVWKDCQNGIIEGYELSFLARLHNNYFDSLTIAMFSIGENTGKFRESMQYLQEYYKQSLEYRQRLRKLLFMPFITLVFFLIIEISIIFFLVPRFSAMVHVLSEPLPISTKILFYISECLHNVKIKKVVLLLGGLYIVYKIGRDIFAKYLRVEDMMYYIPIAHAVWRSYYIYFVFKLLEVLMRSGISITQALNCIIEVMPSTKMKIELDKLRKRIVEGASLSDACNSSYFAVPDIITCIKIGETTSMLIEMMHAISKLYYDRTKIRIEKMITLSQPIMILVISSFIAWMLLALYIPIFSLAYTIH